MTARRRSTRNIRYSSSTRRRRRSERWKSVMAVIVVAVVAFVVADYFMAKAGLRRQPPTDGDYLKVITPKGLTEEIINYRGMTVSFNRDKHIPNWVAWELTADEAKGGEPRYNTFAADPNVKGSATPDDYRNSSFDRGHMAPAGDMKWDREAMIESFLMTNIAPQAGTLNRGAWKKLEEKCRQRAHADSAIVIVCGPVPGDPVEMHIGATGVAVPQRFFKVILSPYIDKPCAIGFIMPNGSVPGGMQAHAMTVDQVEEITGFDFFSELPDDIEQEIESKVNFTRWSQLK